MISSPDAMESRLAAAGDTLFTRRKMNDGKTIKEHVSNICQLVGLIKLEWDSNSMTTSYIEMGSDPELNLLV